MNKRTRILLIFLLTLTLLPGNVPAVVYGSVEDRVVAAENEIMEENTESEASEAEDDLTQADPPVFEELETEYYDLSVGAGYRSRVAYPTSFDMRNAGTLTSVKNQGGYNLCWAFSTIACVENSILHKYDTYTAGTPDYSEMHMAYTLYNSIADPLGNSAGDSNDMVLAEGEDEDAARYAYGGDLSMAGISLSQWKGAAAQNTELTVENAFNDEAHLTDFGYFPYADASTDDLKKLLYEYDTPLAFTYYTSASYYNTAKNEETGESETNYYYPNTGSGVNHAAVIVGWDDNYDKSKFKNSDDITSNGAWIVRNSWGTTWGKMEGYFYLSYEDKGVSRIAFYDCETADNYDYNYYYDGTAGVGTSGSLSSGVSAAAVYQVKGNSTGDEVLGAIGYYASSTDSSVKVMIYTDLVDAADPTSGTLAYTGDYNSSVNPYAAYVGYHTVKLDEQVLLKKGTYYAIVIQAVNKLNIVLERSYQSSSGVYVFNASIEDGQTFYKSSTGTTWEDARYHYSGIEASYRIRGYSKAVEGALTPTPTEEPEPTDSPTPTPTDTPEPTVSPTTTPEETPTPMPQYTIRYVLNGGTNNKSNPSTYYNMKVTLKNPTRKGYTFQGWYTSGSYKTKITAIAKGTTGNYTLYAKWKKVTVGKVSSKPTLKNVKTRKLKVSFKKVSGAAGYVIRYSTSSKYKKYKYIFTTNVCKTLKKLKKNKTYYVKVRAYKLDSAGKKVYGKFSSTKKIKITK